MQPTTEAQAKVLLKTGIKERSQFTKVITLATIFALLLLILSLALPAKAQEVKFQNPHLNASIQR